MLAKEGRDVQDAWLRLNALELATHRKHTLLEAFGSSPQAIFAASADEWRERMPLLSSKRLAYLSAARGMDTTAAWKALERCGGSLVTLNSPEYPAKLRELPDAPPVLLLRGQLIPEDQFSVAIVGTRRATLYGLEMARRFGHELAAQGLTVISGGARGVDTKAHRGALEAGGRTLAFLGCGVDIDYPSENKRLFAEIADGHGAVLSEFPMGATPDPWHFPARNRLISGSSLGVLVVESPLQSGSLITAREAADQGREVFAIPGPIGLGHSDGCHKLIQDGVKLVMNINDILSELGILSLRGPDAVAPATIPNLPPEQRRVLDMLTLHPRQVEGMIQESGLTAPQVMGILTLLEMRGLARRVPGNAFVRML